MTILTGCLMAQQRLQPLGKQEIIGQTGENKSIKEFVTSQKSTLSQDAWQKPISLDYLIGPGDIFEVSIVSLEQVYYQIPVGPAGELHIPGVGVVEVKDLTLKESVQKIQDLIHLKYPTAGIEVSFFQTKRLKIPVTGAVMEPQVVEVSGNACLSEVLSGLDLKPIARLYEVLIQHQTGSVDTVNVLQYWVTGDKQLDPELIMGDRIHIPYGTVSNDIVEVTGEREEISLVAIEPESTLEYFLNSSIHFSRDVYIGHITVLREGEIYTLQPSEYNRFILKAGDRIALHRNKPVNVIGFVQLPGAYPYYPNFTVGEYLSLAGGLSKESSMKSIQVYHDNGTISTDIHALVNPGDVIEAKRSFSHVMMGDMNVLNLITTTASLILTWIAATK